MVCFVIVFISQSSVFLTCQGGALTAAFKGLKQRFTFLLPHFGLMEALEAAKVSQSIG